MATMTFDEFLTNVFRSAGPEMLAYHGTALVLTPTDRGRVMVQEPVWCFAERGAAGQWDMERYRTEELYLMARWITSAWGRNTTGEGRQSPEPEKDLLTLVAQVLERVCPRPTWLQASRLFQAITAGTLSEQGEYNETVGDGVLEEYEFTYAFKAVKLRPLYRWLIENGLLVEA